MSEGPAPGAYGLALPDLPGRAWLGDAAPDWPAWSFVRGEEPVEQQQVLSSEVAFLRLATGGSVSIDRRARTTTVSGPDAARAEAYVHPLLGSTAVVAAEWSGRLAFHAAAFLDRSGRAWGLLGDRGSGKSTTLAWLASHDVPVVADDLVVTDGDVVLAGPRCVDLRPEAAERFAVGTDIGVVGTRRRVRVDLGRCAPTAPLAGWIVLRWSATTEVLPCSADERAAALTAHRALRVAQRHPLPWLAALAKPAYVFGRPQAWETLEAGLAHLVDAVDRTAAV